MAEHPCRDVSKRSDGPERFRDFWTLPQWMGSRKLTTILRGGLSLSRWGLTATTLAVAIGVLAAPASAVSHSYRECQINTSTLGTRAAIKENGTWSTSGVACIAFYSDVGSTIAWIQTGMFRCFNGLTVDGTCSGGTASYAEVKNPGVAAACTQGSGVSGGSTHTYTVDNTSGSQWRAYVDGSLLGGAWNVSGSQSAPNENGEYYSNDANACIDTFTASATFGASSPVWQLWNGSAWNPASGYYAIPSGCSGTGGWSNSGSPSPWTTSH